MRILFANIGWMLHYQGNSITDKISGGGSYRDEDKHEAYNFSNLNGYCYGYVQPVRGGTINLHRIDSSCKIDQAYLEDVLVIWTASRPDTKGTYIVGWYEHATVYREWKENNAKERNGYSYNIKAKYKDCYLLPVDTRFFEIPRARKEQNKGFMGQSNVWYADANIKSVIDFRNTVVEYLKSKGNLNLQKRNKLHTNIEAKRQVEKIAIDVVSQNYRDKGYKITSVEKENKGWDLEATRGRIKLNIEVKGLAEESLSVHLTENEYKAMRNNYNYRLCVVTCTLKNPLLSTFIFDGKFWICEEDSSLILSFKEKIAAIAYL